MLEKIEPDLLQKVSALKNKNKKYKCVVYCNDIITINKILHNNNIKIVGELSFINAIGINANINEIIKLSKISNVEYITRSLKVTAMVNVSKNIIGVNTNNANDKYINVAIIDTGIYPHMDFVLVKNKILHFKDFVNGKTIPYDDNGHGTMVAGILSSSGIISGNKYSGIDNNIRLIVIKALDKNGEDNAINILKAMQWVYDNNDKYNIKIVCMSFGSNVISKNDPLIVGAEALWNKGIIVVSACGNNGPENETIMSPAASSKIIAVGALNDNRIKEYYNVNNFEVADFSSRGPILNNYKPDLITSGVNITASCNFGLLKKYYDTMSGTSMSTPIIAGICAKMIRDNNNLSPNMVKKILIDNCNSITGDKNSEGFGWLNLNYKY